MSCHAMRHHGEAKQTKDRRSPVATDPRVWRRITEDLAGRIRRGDYDLGDRLPGVQSLAKTYEVAPGTIVKAEAHLERIGVLRKAAGAGAFVAALPPEDIWPDDEPTPDEVEERLTRLEDVTSGLDDRTGVLEAMVLELREQLGRLRPGVTPPNRKATTQQGDAKGHGRSDRAVGT